TAERSAASASRRSASAEKAFRAIVSIPVASFRSGSLAATPTVLVPRSKPIRTPREGKYAAASTSGKMTDIINRYHGLHDGANNSVHGTMPGARLSTCATIFPADENQ